MVHLLKNMLENIGSTEDTSVELASFAAWFVNGKPGEARGGRDDREVAFA
jgi:hypothetical protein